MRALRVVQGLRLPYLLRTGVYNGLGTFLTLLEIWWGYVLICRWLLGSDSGGLVGWLGTGLLHYL